MLSQLERYAQAIRNLESRGSGDYSALGPPTKKGDRAYGAYQVMGENIPSWTKDVIGQALTPDQFLANRDVQDAVFRAQFGKSLEKYGNPYDAASVWFTGRPRGSASGASADVLGTDGNQYDINFRNELRGLPQQAPANKGATQMLPMMPKQEPKSFLQMLGLQKQTEGAEGEDGQKFYQRDTTKNNALNLASALNSLRLNPDAGLDARVAATQGQRKQAATNNRTAQYLNANGFEDLAKAVLSGSMTGQQAYEAARQQKIAQTNRSNTMADQKALARFRKDLERVPPTVLEQRQALLNEAGIDPTSSEGQYFLLNGKTQPAATDNTSAQMQLYTAWKADNPDGTVSDFLKEEKGATPTEKMQFYKIWKTQNPNGTLEDFSVAIGDVTEAKPDGLSEGNKAKDKDFAKIANKWQGGGKTDALKLINQLSEAADALGSGRNLSGPLIGIAPDQWNAFFNPEAIDVREKVQEVVARNLKEILGGQFAQKEGEQLLARAYNPKLGEAENRRRVQALLQQVQQAAIARDSMVKYFNQNNGSLVGYEGAGNFDPDGFIESLDSSQANQRQTGDDGLTEEERSFIQ